MVVVCLRAGFSGPQGRRARGLCWLWVLRELGCSPHGPWMEAHAVGLPAGPRVQPSPLTGKQG